MPWHDLAGEVGELFAPLGSWSPPGEGRHLALRTARALGVAHAWDARPFHLFTPDAFRVRPTRPDRRVGRRHRPTFPEPRVSTCPRCARPFQLRPQDNRRTYCSRACQRAKGRNVREWVFVLYEPRTQQGDAP